MQFIKDNIKISESGCWEWQKSCSSSGYGQFTRHGKYWNTHRFVWEWHYDIIPDKIIVRHLCHNTKCCNIDHLTIGDDYDNYMDSIEKHMEKNIRKRKKWIVNGVVYETCRQAVMSTGISIASIIKHTCPETRVFDIDAYNRGLVIANRHHKQLELVVGSNPTGSA